MTTENCVEIVENLPVWTVTMEPCDAWTITVTDEEVITGGDGTQLDFSFAENSGHIITIGL